MAIIFLEGHLFCSTCFLTKKDKYIKIFSMLHHEESPKKPQYSNPPFLDKAPPRFCLNPLFLAEIFRSASRFHQFWISWAPTRYEGAGVGGGKYGLGLHYVGPNRYFVPLFIRFPYIPAVYFDIKYHPTP